MGRKAMTPEQQAARGNPGKRPVRKRETTKTVLRRIVLSRPTWLTDKLARRVWGQLHAHLPFLRDSDVNAFGRYCQYLADWVTANKEIATGQMVYETSSAHVEGMLRINPWFTVRSRLEDDLVKLEEKIGMTPIDRQRIIVGLAAGAGHPLGDMFADRTAEDEGGGEGDGAKPAMAADAVETIGGLGMRRLDG